MSMKWREHEEAIKFAIECEVANLNQTGTKPTVAMQSSFSYKNKMGKEIPFTFFYYISPKGNIYRERARSFVKSSMEELAERLNQVNKSAVELGSFEITLDGNSYDVLIFVPYLRYIFNNHSNTNGLEKIERLRLKIIDIYDKNRKKKLEIVNAARRIIGSKDIGRYPFILLDPARRNCFLIPLKFSTKEIGAYDAFLESVIPSISRYKEALRIQKAFPVESDVMHCRNGSAGCINVSLYFPNTTKEKVDEFYNDFMECYADFFTKETV